MGERQVLGNISKIPKEALVGQQEAGAEVLVETEGVLQTLVSYQKCPALRDNDKKTQHDSSLEQQYISFLDTTTVKYYTVGQK